jgi:hypothetical protein
MNEVQLYSFNKQKQYLRKRPARKSIKRLTEEIHKQTAANMGRMEADKMVKSHNMKIMGWANYFSEGTVSKACKEGNRYVTGRLRQWFCRKHKIRNLGTKRFPDELLYSKYGLINLVAELQNFQWAKA